jgi:hypothetical protein
VADRTSVDFGEVLGISPRRERREELIGTPSNLGTEKQDGGRSKAAYLLYQ